MASKTEICNMAISHLGIGIEIANVDTERSAEAAACRRFYEDCRRATLKDFPLPFSRKFGNVSLIRTNPTIEWGYEYRIPVDCVQVRRIVNGIANETHQSKVPYIVSKDNAGKTILCNQPFTQIEYTEDVKDPSFYSSDFNLALSFRLAAYIAPRITRGDPFKLKQEMLAQYDLEIGRTNRNASNEQQNFQEPDSELIRVRG